MNAKPFLKWAGGKKQLLSELVASLPLSIIKSKTIEIYIEPFVGGGSFFFYLQDNFKIKKSYLLDINEDLILTFKVIKKESKDLISLLGLIEKEYLTINIDKRVSYYYEVREKFNKQITNINYQTFDKGWITRAAQVIFLNKTCFNGLFRSNSKGEFNVPFGRYTNPKICDSENINAVSSKLKNTELICGDFELTDKLVYKQTLIYLDPPYRPVNKTSSFTTYSKDGFTDDDQIRLANYYINQSNKGAYLILSNSDPKNYDVNDNFFDDLYSKFRIRRVLASRFINSNKNKRGKIKELIITNY